VASGAECEPRAHSSDFRSASTKPPRNTHLGRFFINLGDGSSTEGMDSVEIARIGRQERDFHGLFRRFAKNRGPWIAVSVALVRQDEDMVRSGNPLALRAVQARNRSHSAIL
jgi:hypothetical protein